jgi:hypothetical protein
MSKGWAWVLIAMRETISNFSIQLQFKATESSSGAGCWQEEVTFFLMLLGVIDK